jgi:tetratricopeptide (TPR) repeat protein
MTMRRSIGVRAFAPALVFVLGAPVLLPAVPGASARADDVPPAMADAPPKATDAANPVESKKQVELGDVAREEGHWVEAATAYSKALDADEDNYFAHLRYQEAVTEAGSASALVQGYDELLKERGATDRFIQLHRLRLDPAAARITALTALLKATPGDAAILLELGRAQLALGDVGPARKSLEAAFAAKPDFADVLALSVEALRRSGDGAGARARLEAAQKARPEDFEALLRLARLDLAEGKHDNAMKRADAVIGMRPTYLSAFFVKSEAASRLGKVEDARNALDAILKSRPDDPDAMIAVADFVAKTATKEGLEKAVSLYKKVLTLPHAPQLRAHYGLGWALERSNQLDPAAAEYREAGLLAPGDAAVVNSVGVVLLKQKKFQDAIVQFKKAIDLDPLAPEAYANMGAVADEQADWNEGIKWYLTVLKIKGQDKNIRALLNCAFDYEAVGNYKKAEELLDKVRSIRPDDAEVVTFVGDNLTFQKKWKSAIKAYLEATKLDEKNRFAWRGLGIAYSQDDQEDKAIEALERAKALKSDDATTLLVLGDLYMGKGELEKALADFEAYVKAGGSNGDIPALIEQLKAQIEAKKK